MKSAAMKPFNIKTKYGQQEVVLTILKEDKYFLIIYYGGIFGALQQECKNWELLPDNEIAIGHLPHYERGAPGERIEIEWSDHLVQRIGTEIELYLEDDPGLQKMGY